MTVSSSASDQPYTGNGATVAFAVPFYFLEDTDLVVQVTDADGAVHTKVLGTDYTVAGAGDETGGTVTFVAAPASGTTVDIARTVPITQLAEYVQNTPFPASTQERALDKLTMICQQIVRGALMLNAQGLYDAHGHRIINLGDAIALTDAMNQQSTLALIEQVLNGTGPTGGVLSVSPKFWEFTGDGVSTDFELSGADVDNLLFYDVALAGVLQEPYDGYSIVGDATAGFAVRFVTAPADGVAGWAVLRGYARPYGGEQPITTVASSVTTVTGDTTLDNSHENTLILVNSATDVTLTIPDNTGASTDWKDGEFFSVMQVGTGKVTLAAGATGTLYPSPGFVAETRGQNSIISASCIYADANHWAISGDLLAATTSPETHAFTLPCSDEATTNIAVATNVYRFQMPYGLLLTDVRATLNVAQASGTVLTVDVKQNGTSIFSTLLTIDNTETTSTTGDVPYVLAAAPNDTVLEDGALISVDVTQVGTAGARGLKVQLIGQRAS